MSRRTKVVIAVVIILALLLLGLWFWLTRRTPAAPAPAPAAPTTNAAPKPGLPTAPGSAPTNISYTDTNTAAPAPKPAAPQPEAVAKKLAMWFAERYGSYSVQGDFGNIVDLEPVMSARMAAEQQAYVDAQRAQARPQGQSGTSTVALNGTVKSMDDAGGSASVLVKTQRTSYVGTAVKGTTKYQDILIGLVKESGGWKVDSAVWQ
jgi:hypothetical protein